MLKVSSNVVSLRDDMVVFDGSWKKKRGAKSDFKLEFQVSSDLFYKPAEPTTRDDERKHPSRRHDSTIRFDSRFELWLTQLEPIENDKTAASWLIVDVRT